MLRELAKRNPAVYRTAAATRERLRAAREERDWRAPYLPPRAKRSLLARIGREHGLRVLVETGTYEGETVFWLRNDFDRIVTIELEPRLYELARARFAPYRHVEVVHGDSAAVLPGVLERLDRPALFWLDSHVCTTKSASGGSPAAAELELVLSHPVRGHAVLVDDVRLLDQEDWPTLDELRALADRFGRRFECSDDIVRVLPA